MPSTVDYDRHYRLGPDQCGAPFDEFLEVLGALPWSKADVLDLGCGQGRDAIPWARAGHRVVGVDLSAIGIAQVRDEAKRARLPIEALVDDVMSVELDRQFEVVLLNRTLHLLPDEPARRIGLDNAAAHLQPGGLLLIADTPSNARTIRAVVDDRSRWWPIRRDPSFHFAQKLSP